MTSATSLKLIRLTHHYIGVFFAPTILFFAITGSLQMFGLHETSRGSSYVPPAILVHLSQLHKKGTLYLPPRKAAPSAPARADGPKADALKPDASKSPAPTPSFAGSQSTSYEDILRCDCSVPHDIDLHRALYVVEVCTAQSRGCWHASGGNHLPTALTVSMMAGCNLTSAWLDEPFVAENLIF